ncbi:three-helix bundle dimerization domain-containing protein [Amycolatopsis sp. lyj-23]|uniref:three-helix bundle dimerization domain-containing protein n=1 Tax=Amycolatopsis sp. lyj-23 TaxID=2789283 RepID=UPI00397DABC2
MSQHPDMDELAAKGEDDSFEALASRLIDEYGEERRDDVQAAIAAERRRLDDADVRSFLPVLVERSVRDRLERA